ncbi:MAG: hypothetical protein ABJB09_07445 [Verrucomicrobiota bacterium]
MKKLFVALSLTLLALSFILPDMALAKSKKKSAPTPPPQSTIAAVSPTSITITEGTLSKTYSITPFTEIVVRGQRATVAELQPGMVASVAASTSPNQASRINAAGAAVGH